MRPNSSVVPTTYVLGLGNVLMGDDGFGPAVVSAFEEEYVVGPDVSVVDLGTPGLDLTPWLVDAGHVVIVDTITTSVEPGTVCLFDKSDLLRHAPTARVAPHDPGLKETVLALEFAGRAPRNLTIVGVVPERVGLDLELSPCVREAILRAVAAVVAVLDRGGNVVKRRPVRAPHSDWWARRLAG